MRDNILRYGAVTRLLHGLIGGLVLAQLLAAGAKRLFGRDNPFSELLSPYHGDIGWVLLVLVTIRILWALTQVGNRPKHEENTLLVKAGHLGLYLLMFLTPLLGAMIAFGGDRGADVFGLQLREAGEQIAWMRETGKEFHSPIAILFSALVAGHIGAALYHRFVRRDAIMARMFGAKA